MNRESRDRFLVNAGFVIALAMVFAVGLLSWRNMRAMMESDRGEIHTYIVIQQLDRLFSDLKDMESGTRGFVITGEPEYLGPFRAVRGLVEGRLDSLRVLVRENPEQQKRLEAISALVLEKLSVMQQTVDLREKEGFRSASQLVITDWGLMLMEKIRTLVDTAEDEEEGLLHERYARKVEDTRKTIRALLIGSLVSISLLVIVFSFLRGEINRRIRVERELRDHRDHLEELVNERTRDMETFDYSVSHNLRAPLRSIDGFSQVLLEDFSGKLGGEGEDYLHRLRASAQHMGDLIDDILALSRITREKVHPTEVDLSALARSILESHKRYAPGREVKTGIQEHVLARGDAHLLRIAMTHLLDNAWKFTSKVPDARIGFGAIREKGHTVYFVRDNGAGFDTRYADKIFLPFQRLHTEAEFPGTGIGLPIVKRVIERHGGHVWAESEPGKGAEFFFTLGE